MEELSDELPPLDPDACLKLAWGRTTVANLYSFTAARDVIKGSQEAQGKPTVLNVASDLFRGSVVFRRLRWVGARFNDGYNDAIYLVLGGSSLLSIHLVRNFERVVLPMVEPRPRSSHWDLFSWRCHRQRRC